MPSVNFNSVPKVWDSVLADLVEGLGDQGADLLVAGGDGGDVGHVGRGLDVPRQPLQLVGHGGGGRVDAALEGDRVGAGRDRAQALVDERLGEHGRGGGAVAGHVVGLGRDLLGQLRAEVLERIGEFHLLGHGHAVVGDGRGAPLLVQDDVASLRPQGDLHGVGEGVDTTLERAAGLLVELKELRHVLFLTW